MKIQLKSLGGTLPQDCLETDLYLALDELVESYPFVVQTKGNAQNSQLLASDRDCCFLPRLVMYSDTDLLSDVFVGDDERFDEVEGGSSYD